MLCYVMLQCLSRITLERTPEIDYVQTSWYPKLQTVQNLSSSNTTPGCSSLGLVISRTNVIQRGDTDSKLLLVDSHPLPSSTHSSALTTQPPRPTSNHSQIHKQTHVNILMTTYTNRQVYTYKYIYTTSLKKIRPFGIQRDSFICF